MLRIISIIASNWTNNYVNFDICYWSKTDPKKVQKRLFRGLTRHKTRNLKKAINY